MCNPDSVPGDNCSIGLDEIDCNFNLDINCGQHPGECDELCNIQKHKYSNYYISLIRNSGGVINSKLTDLGVVMLKGVVFKDNINENTKDEWIKYYLENNNLY